MLQKDVDDVHAFANMTMKAILSIKAMKNRKARIHMIKRCPCLCIDDHDEKWDLLKW